jgi:hypothetical protein
MEETMSEENEVKDPAGLLAAYEKAKADLVALRNENKALQSQVETLNADEFRARALKAETKLALQAQGIKDVDRLMPYIGTEGLDFDADGKVSGLSERMESLRKDLPEVFDPKVRAGGKADIFANDSVETKQDPFRAAIHSALSH